MENEPLPLRVVVADDHPDAAESLAMLMQLMSDEALEPVVALDGGQAVAAAQRIAAQVAILDIDMPVLDGVQAARQIRHLLGPAVRLIAVSGSAQALQRAAAATVFDHAMGKPVDVQQLLRLIEPRAA